MKNFKKNFVKAQDLSVDDYIKVAGVLYRIHNLYRVCDEVDIRFHNVRRPKLEGALTLHENALTKIWNQK